jgi:hypothetical protein
VTDAETRLRQRCLAAFCADHWIGPGLAFIDDSFVVPVPTTSSATGFFRADNNASIATEARDDVARKLADALSGRNAVAVGTSGRPGLALDAAGEQSAVSEALGNCAQHDSDCHLTAIGPFAVGPN